MGTKNQTKATNLSKKLTEISTRKLADLFKEQNVSYKDPDDISIPELTALRKKLSEKSDIDLVDNLIMQILGGPNYDA